MYKIIDYYNGEVIKKNIKTRREAERFQWQRNKDSIKDKEIAWNFLTLIQKQ